MPEEEIKIPDEGKAARPAAPKKTKKTVRQVSQGRIYIQASYNNTMITATDLAGNVLAWSSAGHLGFKGPKKATPFAATNVVRDLSEKVRSTGLREVHVLVRGVGSGREASVRALNLHGFVPLSIKDKTPIPHNGCRVPRPRRV